MLKSAGFVNVRVAPVESLDGVALKITAERPAN
jgi:hypothetical protein